MGHTFDFASVFYPKLEFYHLTKFLEILRHSNAAHLVSNWVQQVLEDLIG